MIRQFPFLLLSFLIAVLGSSPVEGGDNLLVWNVIGCANDPTIRGQVASGVCTDFTSGSGSIKVTCDSNNNYVIERFSQQDCAGSVQDGTGVGDGTTCNNHGILGMSSKVDCESARGLSIAIIVVIVICSVIGFALLFWCVRRLCCSSGSKNKAPAESDARVTNVTIHMTTQQPQQPQRPPPYNAAQHQPQVHPSSTHR